MSQNNQSKSKMIGYKGKKYKIESVKQFTDEVKLFKVRCNMNPRPGNFFEVAIPGIGECPLASCSYNKKYIEILMKDVGKVTTEIFKLKEGERMYIRGPYGKGFPLLDLEGKDIILVAAGTGIAPITSMISYIEQNREKYGKVWIYFGFRDQENILLTDRIKNWEKIFNVHVGLSREQKSCRYERGHVNDIMLKHKPQVNHTYALLCGPEGMMTCVIEELNKLGVTNDKIYVSLERRMECGFGSCGRCQLQDVYVCKDGPVFRYDRIKPKLDNENWSNSK